MTDEPVTPLEIAAAMADLMNAGEIRQVGVTLYGEPVFDLTPAGRRQLDERDRE